MDEFRKRDPVLRLLPEVPDVFARMDPEEQHWRGRLWLALFGAGYEQDHAWWFVLENPDDFEGLADAKAQVLALDDSQFPHMLKGRLTYEAGKTLASPGNIQ